MPDVMEPDAAGTFEITLAGQVYPLRPTMAACVKVEKRLGRGVIALAGEADARTISLMDAATIFAELMTAGGSAANPEKVAEMLFGHGLIRAQMILYVVLVSAAMGGVDPKTGEPKAASEAKTV